jgi:hypothetical protein
LAARGGFDGRHFTRNQCPQLRAYRPQATV